MTDSILPADSRGAPRRPRRRTAGILFSCALVVGLPTAAAAQFGPVEALAARVSDLSFYYGTGGLTTAATLEPNPFGIRAFGVELLFEVAQAPTATARQRREEAAQAPTTLRVLERVEIRHVDGRTDTIFHYAVHEVPPEPYAPEEILWTMEVGIGYGQLEGLGLRDPELELRATVRHLPAVSLYLTHEPTGGYVGLRTGFMRTDALQVIDAEGQIYRGRGEAFMMGALAGYAVPIRPAHLFLESGLIMRSFPSVEWTTAPGPLPPGVPRRLDMSGWMISTGVQFPVR